MPRRLVLLGSDEIALPAFAAARALPDTEVVAVYAQPDRPAGRGQEPADRDRELRSPGQQRQVDHPTQGVDAHPRGVEIPVPEQHRMHCAPAHEPGENRGAGGGPAALHEQRRGRQQQARDAAAHQPGPLPLSQPDHAPQQMQSVAAIAAVRAVPAVRAVEAGAAAHHGGGHCQRAAAGADTITGTAVVDARPAVLASAADTGALVHPDIKAVLQPCARIAVGMRAVARRTLQRTTLDAQRAGIVGGIQSVLAEAGRGIDTVGREACQQHALRAAQIAHTDRARDLHVGALVADDGE